MTNRFKRYAKTISFLCAFFISGSLCLPSISHAIFMGRIVGLYLIFKHQLTSIFTCLQRIVTRFLCFLRVLFFPLALPQKAITYHPRFHTVKQKAGPALSILLILCLGILLSSCAMPPALQSVDCQGFPFDKEFPGDDHRPLWVYYDLSYKWMTGKDGVYYRFYYRYKEDEKLPSNVYNDIHLPHSTKEKKYIEKRLARDKEFDEKYAGEIKKKLLAVAKKKWVPPRGPKYEKWWKKTYKIKPMGFNTLNGHTSIEYPTFLEGDKLPEGLQTPATFLSPDFIEEYIQGKVPEKLQVSYEKYMPHLKKMLRVARIHGSEPLSTLSSRLKLHFSEYVLTYYYLKKYSSEEERNQTARDLADYYSEVAFRSAAEGIYKNTGLLSAGTRCMVAAYYARRVHDYIMTVFNDPEQLEKIKNDPYYRKKLQSLCLSNLEASRADPLIRPFDESNIKKWRADYQVLLKKLQLEKERCIND